MGLNIPGEVAWVLDLLGFEWPRLDEDEIHKAAALVRDFQDDMDASIDRADQRIQEAFAGDSSQASRAYLDAWDENRSGNMRQLSEALGPTAVGVDLFADAVLALKLKVIAELVITAAQIAAAIASAVVTLGIGAGAQVLIIAARKKALDILTDIMVDEAIGQILSLVIEPIMQVVEPLLSAMLEAPLVSGVVGAGEEMRSDLEALERASGDLTANGEEQERLAEEYADRFMALQITTA